MRKRTLAAISMVALSIAGLTVSTSGAEAAKPAPSATGSLIHITKTINFPAYTGDKGNSEPPYQLYWDQPVSGVVASQWQTTSNPQSNDMVAPSAQVGCYEDEARNFTPNDGSLHCSAFWSYDVAGSVTLHLIIDPRNVTVQTETPITFTP